MKAQILQQEANHRRHIKYDCWSLHKQLLAFVSIALICTPFFYQEESPIYIQSQHAPHLLSEEQQIRLAQRLGLIQHLPVGEYDGSKGKKRE